MELSGQPLTTSLPSVVTLAGTVKEVRAVSWKALEPMADRVLSRSSVKAASCVHALKAKLSMTSSLGLLRSAEVMPVRWKALLPMVRTSGRTNSPVRPEARNASYPTIHT